MQQATLSTLHPKRSADALRKLREAAEKEADNVAPGVMSVVGADVPFDVKRTPVKPPEQNPDDQVGAAKYQGQNSPHIGNGHGGPQ